MLWSAYKTLAVVKMSFQKIPCPKNQNTFWQFVKLGE